MANLFPESTDFTTTDLDAVEGQAEFKGSFLFDFEKGEFIKNPDGTIARCNDLDAFIQWCNMAVITPRYKYLAYSSLYGQEFDDLVSTVLSKKAIELEIERMIKEALTVHPRTRDIMNFNFEWFNNKGEVFCEYDVVTIDNENITLNNTVKVG